MAVPRRSGFTLVELLVVIAIIGVLVALLLPAVQAAREAARRMKCQNNLKQLGIALHNYHDIHGRVPPAGIHHQGSQSAGSSSWGPSWAVMILPMIEQGNLHSQYNFSLIRTRDAPNDKVSATTIPAFLCPSDPPNPAPWVNTTPHARGNYACNSGPRQRVLRNRVSPGHPRRVQPAVLLGHRVPRSDGRALEHGFPRRDHHGPRVGRLARGVGLAAGCLLLRHLGQLGDAAQPAHADQRQRPGRLPPRPARAMQCPQHTTATCGASPTATGPRMPCGAAIPGGVQILLGDGSVRFISNSLNMQTFWSCWARPTAKSSATSKQRATFSKSSQVLSSDVR